MSKRLTDTEKWQDPWYMDLPSKYKLFWNYLTDNCDHSGVWKVNFKVASFYVGEHLEPSEVKRILNERIDVLSDEYWMIKKFIDFQYSVDIQALNPQNKVHLSVLKLLSKFKKFKGLTRGLQGANKGLTRGLQGANKGLTRGLQGANKGLTRGLQGAKDKDKDKDKDKEELSKVRVKENKFLDPSKFDKVPAFGKIRIWMQEKGLVMDEFEEKSCDKLIQKIKTTFKQKGNTATEKEVFEYFERMANSRHWKLKDGISIDLLNKNFNEISGKISENAEAKTDNEKYNAYLENVRNKPPCKHLTLEEFEKLDKADKRPKFNGLIQKYIEQAHAKAKPYDSIFKLVKAELEK